MSRETKDIFLTVCPQNKWDAPTVLDIINRRVIKQQSSPTTGVRTTDYQIRAGNTLQSTTRVTLSVCKYSFTSTTCYM